MKFKTATSQIAVFPKRKRRKTPGRFPGAVTDTDYTEGDSEDEPRVTDALEEIDDLRYQTRVGRIAVRIGTALESIKDAAMLTPEGELFTGLHHGEAVMNARDSGWEGESEDLKAGFLTSEGRFVSRAEAQEIAVAAEQYKAYWGEDKGLPRPARGLGSEDLKDRSDEVMRQVREDLKKMKLVEARAARRLRKITSGFVDQTTAYFSPVGDVQIGDYVRPSTNSFRESFPIEGVFEKSRLEVAPEAPSRLGAIFLCPNPGACSAWGGKESLYEVEIESGKPWMADAELYTMGNSAISKDPIRAEVYADEYWQKKHGGHYFPELLLAPDAKVRVTRKVV